MNFEKLKYDTLYTVGESIDILSVCSINNLDIVVLDECANGNFIVLIYDCGLSHIYKFTGQWRADCIIDFETSVLYKCSDKPLSEEIIYNIKKQLMSECAEGLKEF